MTNSWEKSIVLITTMLTLLRPAMGGLGDFLSSIVNTCHYSACESHPKCSVGYDTLSTTREGCSGFKEKIYCCPSGMGPQCYFTGCGREVSCPGNYRELDRTRNGCSGFATKTYCCKTTNLPHCFDLICPAFSESAKSCPPEYEERSRAKGRSAGCDSAFAERITCCLRGNNGIHGTGNFNSGSNAEVISETKTITLDDGTVQTVTRTQSRSKSSSGIFSDADSAFGAFFKFLLLIPSLVAVFRTCNRSV